MTELIFQVLSATNYSNNVLNIFHKYSRNLVGWQSTQYAITPISILFKLQQISFVTQLYLNPKLYKSIKQMQVLVSYNNYNYQSIAKIYDFNDNVRIQVSIKCQYIKFIIHQKQQGVSASIDFLRIYGHKYFQNNQQQTYYSSKKQKIDQILLQIGLYNYNKKWNVDNDTLITLFDMSKLKDQYLINNQSQNLNKLIDDIKIVINLGSRIKQLQNKIKWLNIKQQYKQIKNIQDQIKLLKQKRDFYDQKYQTSRFQDMISMDQYNSNHDQILKKLLQQDKEQLQRQKRQRQRLALQNQQKINQEYQQLQGDQWWKNKNQLDDVISQQKTLKKKKSQPQQDDAPKYKFDNPYVYNQGDADMERFIKPLLTEFGGGYFGDPDLLRKYQQLDLLDVLGARIWVAAHSQHWRQRAAAVQAVLNFSQSELPQRYKDGKTRNLFLALMEFARITAEDKVLQIYYTALKIMTVALAPPICGQDVSPALINKSVQKFLSIIIEKISQMNSRAKQISLKTLISIFQHPATDINIAIHQCLRVCRQDLNLKYIPVDKQNPRIIQSRLQIIESILTKVDKKKMNYHDILTQLIEGSLHHSHNEIRVKAVQVLILIYQNHQHGTIQWYKSLTGLKPTISSEIQAALNIH